MGLSVIVATRRASRMMEGARRRGEGAGTNGCPREGIDTTAGNSSGLLAARSWGRCAGSERSAAITIVGWERQGGGHARGQKVGRGSRRAHRPTGAGRRWGERAEVALLEWSGGRGGGELEGRTRRESTVEGQGDAGGGGRRRQESLSVMNLRALGGCGPCGDDAGAAETQRSGRACVAVCAQRQHSGTGFGAFAR